MRAPEFSEEQIATAMRQLEAGVPADEICKSLDVPLPILTNWQSRYRGLSDPELAELIRLEREVANLGALVSRLIIGTQLAILVVAIFGVRAVLQP